MGGAIYFRDASGDVVQAGADHPLPVTSAGGGAAQMMAAPLAASTPDEDASEGDAGTEV